MSSYYVIVGGETSCPRSSDSCAIVILADASSLTRRRRVGHLVVGDLGALGRVHGDVVIWLIRELVRET